MSVLYLPHSAFSCQKSFFYHYYTAETEYALHNHLQYHDFYGFQFFRSITENPNEILGYVTLEDTAYPLFHNTLVLVNIFQRHKVEISSKNYTRFCIDASPNFLYLASSADANLMELFQHGSSVPPLLYLSAEQALQMANFFESLLNRTEMHSNGIYEKGILCIFLAQLYHLYQTQFALHSKQLLSKLMQYIDSHLEEPLSLQELSDALHFSTYYLSHTFKECTNISLRTYILERKIELAKRILPDYTPAEVAEKIGFRHYSSFFRAFKRLTGSSPSAYKIAIHEP